MADEVSICNTALLMANANEINSFEDSTREARMCRAFYATTKDNLLQKHPWSFTLFQEQLAQTVNKPLFDWEFEYQLPTGVLRVNKTDGAGNEYRILKDKLFSNTEPVELLFQKDPGEEFWPAYFRRLVEFKMAEDLSLSLVQDQEMARAYAQKFLINMREARGIDSQNSPNMLIPDRELSLTNVRITTGT